MNKLGSEIIKLLEIQKNLYSYKNSEKEKVLKRFFKTGKGEYGEGDQFLGITVPVIRKLAKLYQDIELELLEKLIKSKFHEERALAIFILVLKYQSSIKSQDLKIQKTIFKFYIKNTPSINNWDLVDLSAPYLSGHYFYNFKDKNLEKLLKSKNVWERRIAILSGFYFIRQNSFEIPLRMIEMRLYDKEDLMHKACGWMLREVGKRDTTQLKNFLNKHAANMPRTALRYSIEKMTMKERKYFMNLKAVK